MSDTKMTPAALKALLQGDMENARIATTPGGIEKQEKQGQIWFQDAGVLPREILHSAGIPPCTACDGQKGEFLGENYTDFEYCEQCGGSGSDEASRRKVSEETGIGFGEPYDKLFIEAELPEGWYFEPTDHSMWSHLCDDQGSLRAKIFYKAAFYDRKAHISFMRRYLVTSEYQDSQDPLSPERTVVMDRKHEEVIYVPSPIGSALQPEWIHPELHDFYDLRRQTREKARQWLEEKYPASDSSFAYW